MFYGRMALILLKSFKEKNCLNQTQTVLLFCQIPVKNSLNQSWVRPVSVFGMGGMDV